MCQNSVHFYKIQCATTSLNKRHHNRPAQKARSAGLATLRFARLCGERYTERLDMKLTDIASTRESYFNDDWPPKEYFVHESDLESEIVDGFRELVHSNSGEKAIDKFISENPIILTSILDIKSTGHHAAWVVPKKNIRPHISKDMPGLIPDFLVGGKNSYGITWYVVELKGAEHKLFSKIGGKLQLSGTANKGLCQVLEYMSFCNKSQAFLRDTIKLKDFVSAEGFLFIGRESETEDARLRELKSGFNNINSHLEIRSYDSILRCCDRILGSNNRRVSV